MLREKEFPVYGENGFRGTLLSAARFLDASPEKRIRLEDGREIRVPSEALVPQPDGSYYLQSPRQASATVPEAPQPVKEAEAAVGAPAPTPPAAPEPRAAREAAAARLEAEPRRPKQPVPPRTDTESEPRRVMSPSASEALFREECDVERVPVRRILDRPAEIRHDGDTLIVPLMEEVLVLEKRLMLREELHIKRRREHKSDADRTPISADQLQR